jgi:hypothetical protein
MAPSEDDTAATRERPDSFTRLLAVWVLVGFSLFGLGWDIADALGPAVPLSGMGAGLLFGTSIVSVLWVAGIRPPLLASAAYFLLQLLLGLALFYPVLATITYTPWVAVFVRATSILLAAILVLAAPWRRVRERLVEYLNPAAAEAEG